MPLGVFAVAESPFATAGKFARRHFVYFETVCHASSHEVKIDGRDAVAYKWFMPSAACRVMEYHLVRSIISKCARQINSGKLKYVSVLHSSKGAKL